MKKLIILMFIQFFLFSFNSYSQSSCDRFIDGPKDFSEINNLKNPTNFHNFLEFCKPGGRVFKTIINALIKSIGEPSKKCLNDEERVVSTGVKLFLGDTKQSNGSALKPYDNATDATQSAKEGTTQSYLDCKIANDTVSKSCQNADVQSSSRTARSSDDLKDQNKLSNICSISQQVLRTKVDGYAKELVSMGIQVDNLEANIAQLKANSDSNGELISGDGPDDKAIRAIQPIRDELHEYAPTSKEARRWNFEPGSLCGRYVESYGEYFETQDGINYIKPGVTLEAMSGMAPNCQYDQNRYMFNYGKNSATYGGGHAASSPPNQTITDHSRQLYIDATDFCKSFLNTDGSRNRRPLASGEQHKFMTECKFTN